MDQSISIYCDESCHMEHDRQPVMVLGAIWCPTDRVREIAVRLREIKADHNLPGTYELKWTKVSRGKLSYYLDVLNYFFDDDDLHFRTLVVPDKSLLRHQDFGQDHDTWYYKMYFDMLKVLLSPTNRYRIFLDIKDAHSAEKSRKLRDVLCNNMYDFDRGIIQCVQPVRSHEVEQVQLADLLTGIVSYANRGLSSSPAKTQLVARMQRRSGYDLHRTTLVREEKVNIFRWRAQEA